MLFVKTTPEVSINIYTSNCLEMTLQSLNFGMFIF